MEKVSEKITHRIVEYFRSDTARFSASGREDVDVRMLGNGRPFCIQLSNPRRRNFLKDKLLAEQAFNQLTAEINSAHCDIEVLHLTKISPKQTDLINQGQEEKRKVYLASCYSKNPLSANQVERLKGSVPLEISQKTPIRVLKHRPLLDRKRNIFAIEIFIQDEFHFLLRLETQAGTYVKEFIHGDFGRTVPCVADLMGLCPDDVDIIELDVEDIDLDWPPESEASKFLI